MTISEADWKRYVERLSRLDRRAGEEMETYILKMGTEDTEELIIYANALINKYGEGAAELAAQMYDEMAAASGVDCFPAEPAEISTLEEITRAIQATKHSTPLMKQTVSRMVKQAGADTTLKNAIRDGAQFAWIPGGGETCAFCITLASRGWQNISKKTMRRGHAEHIHANCSCNYTVRFDRTTTVAGYDPDKYLEMYEGAEGGTPEEKIASLRQTLNSQNREKINAQKRAAYAERKRRETGEEVRGYKKVVVRAIRGDVTREYLKTAQPGIGNITYDKGLDTIKHKDEIGVAQWIHDIFGGDINVLNESTERNEKRPDYEWNGKLWELKTVSSLNSVDLQFRKAVKQIADKPGGVILDVKNTAIGMEEMKKTLERRFRRCQLDEVDVFVVKDKELISAFRYKK